jgi:hypothetical protein
VESLKEKPSSPQKEGENALEMAEEEAQAPEAQDEEACRRALGSAETAILKKRQREPCQK